MVPDRSVESVEESDDYLHVRYHDPTHFDEIRTPAWARDPAESVCRGCEVRTGATTGRDGWEIQSVLIPKDGVDTVDEARRCANRIVSRIETSV